MVYFDQTLHTYARQHCLTIGMRNNRCFDRRGFAEHQPVQSWLISEKEDLKGVLMFLIIYAG